MSRRVFFCALVLLTIVAFVQPQTSLDDLIKDIFDTKQGQATTPPATNPSKDDLITNIFINPNNGQTPINVTPGTTPFQPTPTKTTILNPVSQPPVTPTIPNTTQYQSCGFQKECVPRFLCNNDTINSDGTNIIDIRAGIECPYLDVCCDIPNKTTEVTNFVTPAPNGREGCGYRNADGVGFKITGDEQGESQFGEFPWMTAILRLEEAPGETLNLYECGGSLIAPTVVLTAAHCVQTRVAHELIVRAGEWDTQTKSEVLPHQDRNVKQIIVHEKYNKGALFNDIALLIVDLPFVWSGNVNPICLPESNVNFDHARCYATGWGKNTFGKEGTYQVILKKIDLPVVPNNICQANLRTTRLGNYFNLHESFICAGGEKGKDTCKGDGGSPLVCPMPGQKDRFYQAGIVAWGIGCGEENIPGAYANVPYLRQWIDSKLSARNIDFSPFTP